MHAITIILLLIISTKYHAPVGAWCESKCITHLHSTPERDREDKHARQRAAALQMMSPTQRQECAAAATAARSHNKPPPPPQPFCKCVMHLLSHHAPTGAWYLVDIISSNIIVIACTSGMRPYRCIPR